MSRRRQRELNPAWCPFEGSHHEAALVGIHSETQEWGCQPVVFRVRNASQQKNILGVWPRPPSVIHSFAYVLIHSCQHQVLSSCWALRSPEAWRLEMHQSCPCAGLAPAPTPQVSLTPPHLASPHPPSPECSVGTFPSTGRAGGPGARWQNTLFLGRGSHTTGREVLLFPHSSCCSICPLPAVPSSLACINISV